MDLGALIERDTQALSDPPMLRTDCPELRINGSDEAFDPSPAPLQMLQSVVVLSCGQRAERKGQEGHRKREQRKASREEPSHTRAKDSLVRKHLQLHELVQEILPRLRAQRIHHGAGIGQGLHGAGQRVGQ